LCLSSLSYGEDTPPTLDQSHNNALSNSLTGIITSVSEATEQGRDEIIRNAISLQYLETGEKLHKFLKGRGQNISHFEKGILNDFSFYSVVRIDKVIPCKNVAFVEAVITYNPIFIMSRHKEVDGIMFAELIWSSMGGKLFAQKWESNGKGIATFYFVRQNDLWRLHQVYFSSKSLNENQLTTAKNFMQKIVGPNNL
jgi:hypothetical protein